MLCPTNHQYEIINQTEAQEVPEKRETPTERLVKLERFLAEEQASSEPSNLYIADLKDTIAGVRRQIKP